MVPDRAPSRVCPTPTPCVPNTLTSVLFTRQRVFTTLSKCDKHTRGVYNTCLIRAECAGPVRKLARNSAGSRAGRHGLFALKSRQILVIVAVWIERLFGPHPSDLRFGVEGCGLRVLGFGLRVEG